MKPKEKEKLYNLKCNFFHLTLSYCYYCMNMSDLCELKNKPTPSEALAYG